MNSKKISQHNKIRAEARNKLYGLRIRKKMAVHTDLTWFAVEGTDDLIYAHSQNEANAIHKLILVETK